jgi:hypothetical protein
MAKIQVRHKDGRIEVINMVGEVQIQECTDNCGLSCFYTPAIGSRHFFDREGAYDGWEMEISGVPLNATADDPMGFIKGYAAGIDADREFIDPE